MLSLHVDPNGEYKRGREKYTGKVTTTVQLVRNKEDPLRIRLHFELGVDPTPKETEAFFPYRIAAAIRGDFVLAKPWSKEAEPAILSCGAEVLFDVLRGTVGQITGQALNGFFVLPDIDFSLLGKR
ncbi:MAG: hypothetical protein BWK77_02590 [Verrucomicrobia bacterium A1]|nr:MAG: hypothetical protein BWK77_02590 [Verrucomicrobia bacterium A1]